MTEGFHHRATLKQQNKKFKSRHATKSALKEAEKGRVGQGPAKTGGGLGPAAQLRLNRRNNAKQAQLKKREVLASATRVFAGADGAPRIVAVIPLSEDTQGREVIASLAASLDIPTEDCPQYGIWRMRAERFKTSLQFVNVPYKNFYAALDACKTADYVIFVLSTVVEVDAWGDTLLRTLQAQGLPEVVTVVAPNPPMDHKSRTGILKSLLSFIQYFVPTQPRVFDLQHPSDRLSALRALAEGKPGDVRWREDRSWMLGETTEWENGTLKVTGIVRGVPLSANRLIHLPNFGDFQIAKIVSAPAVRQQRPRSEVEPIVLAEPDPNDADSLVSSNDPDDMANEQTWPTEEELTSARSIDRNTLPDAPQGTTPKAVKRVPKGTSEYQAAWIVADDDDGDNDDINDEEAGGENGDENRGATDTPEEEDELVDLTMDDDQEMEIESRKEVHFEDLDGEEEQKQLTSWRNRKREEEEDLTFPDEIDTPDNVSARVRFQRYRGLRSLRTSHWDPYENLPRNYARIFQFEDFKRTERNVRRRAAEEAGVVEPGTRVVLHLSNVPQEASTGGSIVLFSLMQHEHKITTLHFTVQRNTEYNGSVRSKDPLILCVGPRRLNVNPIYSQHSHGGGKGVNNVHKFERYLHHGSTSVATIYAPVLFGHQPCVLLRETENPQAPHLVASGNFLNTDTTRIVAKRIMLTGHPFKVHRKTATIRYMFFNTDDIQYFKPVQMHTKYGRTGHIKESLGTHGYFKAHFDGPITQMDTVCMALYKRVFPKWASSWRTGLSQLHGVSSTPAAAAAAADAGSAQRAGAGGTVGVADGADADAMVED